MIQKFNQYNEGLIDKMAGKSDEEIAKATKDFDPDKSLRLGVHEGLLNLVKKAIEDGADVNHHINIFGETMGELFHTVLQYATYVGNTDIVKELLKAGADIGADENLAHNVAIAHDRKEILELFKQYSKTNEGLRDQMAGKSEDEIKPSLGKLKPQEKLDNGIRHSIPWLVKQALEEGADVDDMQSAALVRACYNGDMKIIKLLLDYGADPFECDYKSIELENRGPKGKEIVELLKQQVKKLYDKQMSESISHNQKEYYNTHGEFAPYSEIRELELERGLTQKDFDEWQTKYDIKDDDLVIWVTKKIRDAYMYLLPASMWNELWEMGDEEAEQLINSEGYTKDDVNVIDADGFIIEESDDGDGGFIFVHRK